MLTQGVVDLIRFLGDFFIDELPDISLNKREMIVLAYLLTKRKEIYLRELIDLFYMEGGTDDATVRKVIRSLSKKLNGLVEFSLKGYKVTFRNSVDVDINLLEDEILNFSNKNENINVTVARIMELYNGHFLPFIDNIWVNSLRNTLKSYVLKIIVKYFYEEGWQNRDIFIDMKIVKLLPELYLNESVAQLYEYLRNARKVNFGASRDFDEEGMATLRVIRMNQSLLERIIRYSNRVDLLTPEEFVIFIEEEKLKALANSKFENVQLH